MRRYDLPRCVATLDISTRDVVWAETGTRGHLTIWAPAGLLLKLVVQCDEDA